VEVDTGGDYCRAVILRVQMQSNTPSAHGSTRVMNSVATECVTVDKVPECVGALLVI
jgi:hypothetical protein